MGSRALIPLQRHAAAERRRHHSAGTGVAASLFAAAPNRIVPTPMIAGRGS